MMNYIPIMINAAVLICGGVTDSKRREIPNFVPVTLFLTGIFFEFSMFCRIIGLIITAVLLFASAKLTKSEVPGGDFKLLCSLGFACGFRELAAIIFLAWIGVLIYGFIKRLPVKQNIPLCAYVALAYIILHVVALALEVGRNM